MYEKCWRCKSNYIEQDEEICLDCSIYYTDTNEFVANLENEEYIEKYGDNELLNDFGTSLVLSDDR